MANIALITNNILSDSGTPLTGVIAGSGTTNYLSKFTSSNAIGNSLLFDDGTNVGIGTATPNTRLQVNGITASNGLQSISLFVETGVTPTASTAFGTNVQRGIMVQGSTAAYFIGKAVNTSTEFAMGISGATGNPIFVGSTSATDLELRTNNAAKLTIFNSTGNISINSSTDSGYKLDVNGTAKVTYSGYNNHSTIFQVNNIAGAVTFGLNIATYSDSGGTNRIVEIGSYNQTGQALNGQWTFNSRPVFASGIQNNFWNNFDIVHMNSNAGQAIRFYSLGPTGGGGVIVSFVNNGNVLIGTTTDTGARLQVAGSITAATAIARGSYFNNTLVAAANNDVLVGLDVAPTFTNGAFTGVVNYGIRTSGDIAFTSSANRYLTMQSPSTSGSGGNMIIQSASANTSGTGGNLYLYVGGGAGGPGPGKIYIGNNNGWDVAYVTGILTVSSTGPNTGDVLRVSGGGRNALTIAWDNVTPFMSYSLVSGRQSRFLSSSSYYFDNNFLIGTTTNAGYKLDVLGDSRIKGSGSTSATTTFRVENSSGGSAFTILGDGTVNMGFNASLTYGMTARSYGSNGGYPGLGVYLISQNYGNAAGNAATIAYSGSPAGVTSNGLVIGGVGLQSATYNALVVNQSYTGLGTNTLVGYLFDPTLDATFPDANVIAIKANKGKVLLGTTSGNIILGTTTDNGNKLQVTGNITASGGVIASTLGAQNSAEINVNESSNNLLVYADITGGSNKLYSGGQVKANIYTSSVTTPTVINTGTTVSLMEWYPTTTQGVMIDYVFYIASGNYMRSGTFTAVNDNSGNTQYVDNATPDLNGSTSTVTFAAVDIGGTIEFQVTNASGSPVYMNILTRYIPNIF